MDLDAKLSLFFATGEMGVPMLLSCTEERLMTFQVKKIQEVLNADEHFRKRKTDVSRKYTVFRE